MTPDPSETSPLQVLIGEQLSAITFVQDYLQLDFDGNRITGYIWPTVRSQDATIRFGSPGFRDALCHVISSVVEDVIESESLIELRFHSGISFSFRLADFPQQEGDRVAFNSQEGEWSFW